MVFILYIYDLFISNLYVNAVSYAWPYRYLCTGKPL